MKVITADEPDRILSAAETQRVWIAMQLSPAIGICESLLRGELSTRPASIPNGSRSLCTFA